MLGFLFICFSILGQVFCVNLGSVCVAVWVFVVLFVVTVDLFVWFGFFWGGRLLVFGKGKKQQIFLVTEF